MRAFEKYDRTAGGFVFDVDKARARFDEATVTDGVPRWNTNNAVPPEDVLNDWAELGLPFDLAKANAARDKDNAKSGPYFPTSDGFQLCRITIRTSDSKRKTYWARKISVRVRGSLTILKYQEVALDGDPVFDGGRRDGKYVVQTKYILITPEDLVSEKPARMNAHYGELELDPTRTELDPV